MRSQDEIVARYEAIKEDDLFGVLGADLLTYVDFEHAKPYLTAEALAEEDWHQVELTDEVVRNEIAGYLSFAWEKADDERGLSANRSIQHFQAWLWLIGDDELLAFAEDDANYPSYGRPILNAITEKYGSEELKQARKRTAYY